MRDQPSTPQTPTENVLLETAAPADVATSRCLDVVAGTAPRERDVLAVTYDRDAEFVVDAWRRHVGAMPGNLGVVVTCDETRSISSTTTAETSTSAVETIRNPEDVAGTRNVIAGFLDEWNDTGNATVVYVDSVSSMVRLVGIEPTIRLIRDVGELLASRGCLGYFRFDTRDADGGVLAVAEPEFDRVSRVAPDDGQERGPDTNGRSRTERRELPLSVDDAFALLADPRRRFVLEYLRRADGPVTVETLAGEIVQREDGYVTADAQRRAYVALRHVHLPKLEARGVVAVDRTRNAVEPRGGAIEWLEPVLGFARREGAR